MLKQLKYLPRISERIKIDELINNSSTTVKDLLFFDIAVDPSKVDIRILRFFLNHFEQFISCLLAIYPVGRPYQVACARILLYHLDFFLENTEILSIFYDYAFELSKYTETSYDSYFYLLGQIIFESHLKISQSLRKEFQNPKFFEILFSRLDINANFFFLYQTISEFKIEFHKFLRKCPNLFNIVVESVLSKSPTVVYRGQLILFNLLKTQSIERAPELFLKDDVLDKIIQSQIENPASGGFLFLKELYLLSTTFSGHIWSLMPKTSSSKWKNVSSIMQSYFGHFCNYIIECDTFTQPIESCCKLCLTLFAHQKKKINPLYISCLKKLCQMFFNYPTNTFLHQSFYQSIEKLKSKKCLTNELIEQLDLSDKIIECYKKRETNLTSAYWGHLRLISNLLDNSKLRKSKEWKEIVIQENKRREYIIKHEYGGFKKIENSSLLLYILLIVVVIMIAFIIYNII